MAVSLDVYSNSTAASYSHAGGTPKGVLIFVYSVSGEDPSGVTYGGAALSQITTLAGAAGEITGDRVSAWLLKTGAPSGTQTVAVSGTPTGQVIQTYSLSASNDLGDAVAATISTNISGENPSTTLALGGETSFVAEIWVSGHDATGSITPRTGWTARFAGADIGASVVGGSYSYDTIDSADVTVGVNQASNDILLLAVGVFESAGGGDIAATGTLSFSGSADLDATGSLAAAGAMAFAASADLDATGALSAAGALAFDSTADLDATGALAAAGALAFASTADLDASGSLAAAGSLAFSSAADLSGQSDNDLAAVGPLSFAGSADLDATGDLAAAGTMAFAGTADLDSAGALAAVGELSIAGVAGLEATGSLRATAALSFAGVAGLDAIGALAGVGALTWGSSAVLSDANAVAQPEVRAITLHRGAAIVLGTQRPELIAHGSIRIDHE